MEGSEMLRHCLRDEEWDLIVDLFPLVARTGRPPVDRRKVVDGIFWVLRTGVPWRDLPAEFGKWQTVWHLFDQWNGSGLWDKIVDRLRAACVDAGDIDTDLWCVDGTIVRAARCAGGGGKKGIPRSQPTMR
jgi:transposase